MSQIYIHKLQVFFVKEHYKRELYSAKRPIIFKEPTNRSHPSCSLIRVCYLCVCIYRRQYVCLCVYVRIHISVSGCEWMDGVVKCMTTHCNIVVFLRLYWEYVGPLIVTFWYIGVCCMYLYVSV